MTTPKETIRTAIEKLASRIEFGKHLKVGPDDVVYSLTLQEAEAMTDEIEALRDVANAARAFEKTEGTFADLCEALRKAGF